MRANVADTVNSDGQRRRIRSQQRGDVGFVGERAYVGFACESAGKVTRACLACKRGVDFGFGVVAVVVVVVGVITGDVDDEVGGPVHVQTD